MNNMAVAVECKEATIPHMATIKEAAKIFGLPEHLVRRKVLNGEVVAISAGRRYLVNVDRFAEYLNTNKLPAPYEQDEQTGIRPIPVNL